MTYTQVMRAERGGRFAHRLARESVKIAGVAIVFSLTGLAQLFGQTNVGSVVGAVTDSSGASISGATVTLLNPATGEKRTQPTSNIGEYTFTNIRPATYNISAEFRGFKTAVRAGVVVQVAETYRVNFALQVGATTQTVEVQGQSPLLQPETSSIGTVISGQTIQAMPLDGRNVYELVRLAPGTSPLDNYGSGGVPLGGMAAGTGVNQISVNGGRNLSTAFTLDGMDNILSGYNYVGVVPTLDAVQEFNVLTNSFSAKYGRSGGGYVTTVTKSGTNQFHGDTWEFLRNNVLDANDFFSNSEGNHLPAFRQNQFGGTAGGPIRRDKTFVFGSYEGFRQVVGGQNLTTVPTDLQKAGDFSQTMTLDANGNPTLMTIYNPFSTSVDANGNFVRQQFMGCNGTTPNVICPTLFDPVAKGLLQYFPEPNLPGDPVTHANNFVSQAGSNQLVDSYLGRIDENINERQRLFGRYTFQRHHFAAGDVLGKGNIADPTGAATGSDRTQGAALSYTNSLSPNTLLTIRYGFVRGTALSGPRSVGFDPAKLGLPASLVSQFEAPVFPRFDIAGYTSVGAQYFSLNNVGATTNSVAASLTKVVGRHSIDVGVDLRLIQGFVFLPGWPAGQFTFDPGFTNGMAANSPDPTSGNGFASFLLGTISNGGNYASHDPHWFFTNRYYAGYVQDDIKVDSKLTLNLGLRYDYEAPLQDRHNQLSWVDFKQQIPINVTQINVPGFGLLPHQPFIGGGAGFPNVNGSGPVQLPQRKNFQPRVGLAYSIGSKTVIRTAYGIIYPGTTADNSGNFPTVQGFNPITQSVLAPDGFTPQQRSDRGFLLSNPYPNGLIPVQGSSLGLLTSIGNTDHGLEHNPKSAYFQQWSFGIQRELPGNVLVEAAYVGSHGVHISDYNAYNADALPDKYLALGNSLYNSYPNPFLGVVPANSTLGGSPTLTLQQLLVPFPEFNGITAGPDYQTSTTYDAFQLKIQKRMSQGLSVLASYTAGKTLDSSSSADGPHLGGTVYQDNNNLRLDHSLSGTDRSQILILSPIYQLPFGRGKAFGGSVSNPVTSQLISGWELGSILTFSTGFPLSINCAAGCTFPANRPNLVANPNQGIRGSNESRLNEWFNTAAFAPNLPFAYGTSPRTLPTIRGPGTANTDLSLIKNTRFRERYNVEFRAEFFNTFNRPQFSQPDASFGSTTFGQIHSQANAPREIQFGLKFYW